MDQAQENSVQKQGENNSVEQLQLLRQIDQAIISSAHNLEEIFEIILAGILNLIGSEDVNIAILRGQNLVVEASTTRNGEGKLLPVNNSVSGMAVKDRKPINIGDLSKEPRFKPIFQGKMQSELAVPLIIGDRVIGVLNTESPQLNAFSQADIDLMMTLAGQASIAIQNARSYQELEALHAIDKAILSAAANLDVTLDTILRHALELIDAEFGSLLLIDGNDLVIQASRGSNEKRNNVRVPIKKSVTGKAFLIQEAVYVPDISLEPLYNVTLKRERMQSELAVPLLVNGRSIGVLNIESPDLDAFADNDRRLLQRLASQAAIAIQHARKFEETEILRDIDLSILSSEANLEETLQTLLKGALQLTDATYGSVMLVEGNHLINKALNTNIEQTLRLKVDIDNSVTGLAYKTKESILIPDVEQMPLYKPVVMSLKMRSELAVPMIANDRVLGVINLESPRLNAFDEHDKELIQMLAGQGAIAIKTAQAMQKLHTLRDIDHAILDSALDLNATLDVILQGSLRLLHASYGQLLLVDGNDLVIEVTTTKPPEKEVGTRVPINSSICGMTVQMQKSLIIDDVDADKQYQRILQDEYMRSEITMPLKENGRVFGVLNIESPLREAFHEEDQETLETLARQASIAIKNAQANKKLRALRKIDAAILNQDLGLGQTLKIVLNESLSLIDAQFGDILLLKGNHLVIQTLSEGDNELAGTKVDLHQSVTGKAALTKQAIIIPDTDQEPLYQRIMSSAYMHSELAMPLMENDTVLGVINVESPRLNAFTESDRELLEALAGQAAIAISKARDWEGLNTLGQIDEVILSSELSLGEKLQIIIEFSAKLLNLTYGNILRVEGDEIVIAATTLKPKEKVIGNRFKIHESVTGKAVLTKQTIIVEDITQEPLYQSIPGNELSRSEIAVPLIVDDIVIGIINLESQELNSFSNYDKKLLETLARQAAIAIKNAQAYEELQQAKAIEAIGETAWWMVHKIGNLALNIGWPVERLIEESHGKSPINESELEDLYMIQKASGQIGDLKQALLSPLRDVSIEPIAINSLLKDVIRNSILTPDEIHLHLKSDLPMVMGPRTELSEVFSELIDNAAAAMYMVENKSLEIISYLTQDEKFVEIKFCDNGCGIPEDKVDEIWAIGYTTKQQQSGTGLGLFKCAQVINRAKGHISATPNIDSGTTFMVRLPIKPL